MAGRRGTLVPSERRHRTRGVTAMTNPDQAPRRERVESSATSTGGPPESTRSGTRTSAASNDGERSRVASQPPERPVTSSSRTALGGERVADNGRLRFDDAGCEWLAGPVMYLRPATQACYRNALEQHLLGRYATRRLDAVTPDDLARLVHELREGGLAESTIVIVIGVVNRIYRYAARRLSWAGTNPVSLMLSAERPKPSQGKTPASLRRWRARADDRRCRRAVSHAVHGLRRSPVRDCLSCSV